MTRLRPSSKATMIALIDNAQRRYDACLKVHGARSGHTRQAKHALKTYTENARRYGYID